MYLATVYDWEKGKYFPEGKNLINLAKSPECLCSVSCREKQMILRGECGEEVGSQLGTDVDPRAYKKRSRVASNAKSNIKISDNFIEIPLLTMATVASCGAGNGLYGVVPESTENIY